MHEILNYELLRTHSLVITVGNILAFVLTLGGTHLILRMLSAVLRRSLRAQSVPEGRQTSFVQLVGYMVWTIGILFGLQLLGVDITFLVASSAALLVGIGLGLQNVFKDFISGVIILLDGTIKADDVVEVDGWVVKVREVSLRTSMVVTRDDIMVIVPNHKFIEENVVNWTHNTAPTRFSLSVGVDYAADIRLVEKVLLECTLGHEDVLQVAPYLPNVRLINFGSSSLDFQLIFWSDNLFRIDQTKSQLRFKIVESFLANGITIPFTQVVVHKAAKEEKAKG